MISGASVRQPSISLTRGGIKDIRVVSYGQTKERIIIVVLRLLIL
jgi:hypothetical protein